MEGKENTNTASRGRAVRPVRRTAGSSAAGSSDRFPDETRSRRSTSASNRSSYSRTGTSENRNSRSGSGRTSEKTDASYRRSSAGRSDYRTAGRNNSETGDMNSRAGSNTRNSGRRAADTDVRRRESREEREARERRRKVREEREARERRLALREEREHSREPEEENAFEEENVSRERSRSTRQRNTRKSKKTDLTVLAVNPRLIGVAAGLLLIIIVIIVGVRSLGSSHKSAANVAKALIQASIDGNISKMKDAYGISGDAMIDMQESLDAAIAYYEAHDVKKVNIKSTGTLFEEGDFTYLYVLYNLVLENDQEYPCIGTYIMQNVEGKYYVLPPSKVTEELSQKATDAYQKFMTTDTYKNYNREYDTFIKKNPGYEEKIAAKLA